MDDRAVIVFLKAPEQGCVKTRLSMDLDESFVLGLYKGFVCDTLDILETGGDTFVCFWPPETGDSLKRLLGNELGYFHQKGNDLGERMSNAFKEIFKKGYEKALLIGTDIPELDRDIIRLAHQALQTADAVIGPTGDGGYYLIGFQNAVFPEDIFNEISWSTASVLDQTLKAMNRMSLQYKLLATLNDIDTSGDLKALIDRVKKGGKAGKRTLKILRAYED
jgi:rSAM/selenodomain-associated transferase 1